ncbi:MAG: ABC transporter ATP-binding protein [Alicyclobacillus sp.]|nr:ABC transporter ATP-binding protein [Alicyclobacillus sp.]
MSVCIEARNVTVAFPTPRGIVRAVDNVSVTINEGDVFALVGESGCGKSTLAFAIMNLVPQPGYVESGEIHFNGKNLLRLQAEELRRIRGQDVAMVFQASMNSFNPVLRIRQQIDHILEAHPDVWPSRADGVSYFKQLLQMVRLQPDVVLNAFPHELSGGMKQRMAIAVSLLLKPKLLLLDEPTTALDVLNQRLVLDILRDLHAQLNITVLFVTHDLGVVAEVADKVGVMYAGKMVDIGTVDEVFYDEYRHPYVTALINAAPSPFRLDTKPTAIAGSVPNLIDLPAGCRFASRCPVKQPICLQEEPQLVKNASGHAVSCHVITSMSAVEREVTP